MMPTARQGFEASGISRYLFEPVLTSRCRSGNGSLRCKLRRCYASMSVAYAFHLSQLDLCPAWPRWNWKFTLHEGFSRASAVYDALGSHRLCTNPQFVRLTAALGQQVSVAIQWDDIPRSNCWAGPVK